MFKRQRLLVLAAPVILVAGAGVNAASAAAPDPLSSGDVAVVQRIAADAVDASVTFKAVRMSMGDAVEAIAPGEQPLGDATRGVAAHTAAVISAVGPGLAPLALSAPRGYKGDPKPRPVGVLLLIDLTTQTQIGGTYVYQQSDLAQVDLTVISERRPASTMVAIEVNPRG